MQVPIDEQTALIDSAPEEAAAIIDKANVLGVEPQTYKEYKPEFDEQIKKAQVPKKAEEPVARYIAQSTEHASLASQDTDVLDYISRQAKLIWDHVSDRPTTERAIVDLNLKKMDDPDNFSEEDQLELMHLNEERESLLKRNYGIDGPYEQLPAQVAGAITDFGRGLSKNAEIIGAFTAGGAGVGAGLGFLTPVPGGAAAGGIAGGVKGFAAGVTAASFKDGYDMMVGSMYNELSNMTDDQGNPMNIDNDTKAGISRGVGVVSGVMAAVVGRTVMKTTPWLAKWMSPKKSAELLMKNATGAAIRTTLANIAKATTIGAGGAGVVETARIVAEEMGRTYDGSEASFLNALNAASQKLDENAKRVAQAAAVGGLTSGTISTATGVLGFKSTKARLSADQDAKVARAKDVTPAAPKQLSDGRGVPDAGIEVGPKPVTPRPVLQSVKVLQLQDGLENITKAAKASKMAELAPGELNNVKQMIFASIGMKKLFLNIEDLRKWATDPKRGERARNIIDESGVAASQMNAPLAVEPHKFMELVREFPDAADLFRMEADGPNPNEARAFLERIQKAEQQRVEVLGKLGIKPEEVQPEPQGAEVVPLQPKEKLPPLKSEETEALVRRATDLMEGLKVLEEKSPEHLQLTKELDAIKKRITDHYKLGEPGDLLIADWGPPMEEVAGQKRQDYLTAPTFTKTIEGVLSETEVKKFNDAQALARKSVDDSIQEAAELDMLAMQDIVAEVAKEDQYQIEYERTFNNPNLAVVDKFRREVVADSKGKNAKSIYAIDPALLSDAQLKYLDNAQLKEHKVLVEGGLSPEDSARLLGVSNGDELLKILANTPTREKIVKARVEAQKVELEKIARDSVDLDHTNLVKAYTNNTKNHLLEMKFMREKKWPALKGGIKRIALPLPRIEELTHRARVGVAKTKVGDLNPTQYKVGERQSQKIAVNAILKNEVEKAFIAKETAALNSEFQKETHVAIARVNRVFRYARRFNDKGVMRELKTAGKLYEDAANEILDVFNLNPSKKGAAEQGSYQRYVKAMVAAGRGEFDIPEHLADIRQNATEMTVEQVLAVGNRLATVLHQARMKNRLFNKYREKELIQTEQALAEVLHEEALKHPNYGKGFRSPGQETSAPGEKVRGALATIGSMFTNMEHVVRELDQGKLAGIWQELIVHPLKGDGAFDKISGYSKELEMTKALKKFIEANIEAYGKKDFENLDAKILDIPEFKDVPGLNKGRLTKGDLITLWAYGGDPYTLEKRGKNFGVSNEVIQKVLDRELEERDVVLAQNMLVNGFKNYKEETIRLQKETTGQDVTFVEGVTNYHRGKAYPGGYIPAKYRIDYTAAAIKANLAALEAKQAAFFGGPEGEYYARQYAAEQTEQGRLIERVGSDKPLDLSLTRAMRGHEEVIHDLSYRKAIIDGLKFLKNPIIREDIISIIGEKKYGLVLSTVIEAANRIEAENANYFSDQSRALRRIYSHFANNLSISLLGFRVTSTLIQYSSIAQLLKNVGPKGAVHFINVNRKMIQYGFNIHGMYEFAAEIDPTISNFKHEIQNKISSTIYDIMPRKGRLPGLKLGERLHKTIVDASMKPMAIVDAHLKVMGALTSYEQFLAGDVDGFPLDVVLSMSPQERDARAKAYARQVSRLSLTHAADMDKAPFQKNMLGEIMSKYWNDLRNILNNQLNEGRKIKWKAKQAREKFKEGDSEGVFESSKSAAATAAGMILLGTLAVLFEDIVRGNPNPVFNGDYDLENTEDQKRAANDFMTYILGAPLRLQVQSSPLVRDVNYGAFNPYHRSRIKKVEFPINKVFNDFATSASTLYNLLVMDREFGSLSKGEIRALLNSFSHTALPLPISGAYDVKKFIDSMDEGPLTDEAQIDKLREEIKEYKKDPPKDADAAFLKELEEYEASITPKETVVPEDIGEVIKFAASGGVWNKKDPNSSAAGLYQFTEEAWQEIMEKAPDLGLTENGRVEKDGFQQELAIEWSSQENAKELSSQDIPVDHKTLYGAHLLGVQNYIKVHKAPADTKLKTVIGTNERFSQFKTVGALKKLINERIEESRKALTSTAGNSED